MTNKTQNLCECGHERKSHEEIPLDTFENPTGETETGECLDCPCKKFRLEVLIIGG